MAEPGAEKPHACVVGWPVAHSRSPLIHGYWLKLYGVPGRYDKQAVSPENLADFLARFSGSELTGANITVPHKEAAFRLVTRTTSAAAAVHAVNTIWLEGGETVGDNTDVHGFLANLDEGAPCWDKPNETAMVLGAGGAARAVLKALIDRGFSKIHLANRTFEKAEALAAIFGPAVWPVAWEERYTALSGCALLVNTTTLGMESAPPLDIDMKALPARAVVTDIVYVPLETPLLRDARSRGLRTVDGLGMLLHQAVPGFERWFGVRPEVTAELRELIVADIEGLR